jgi:hypothetical protein
MNPGTKIEMQLIADARFLNHCADLETLISVHRSSLKTSIHGEGIEIYQFEEERLLNNWEGQEKEAQIRQKVVLMLSKKLTKNRIYQIINQVQSQPLKFIS